MVNEYEAICLSSVINMPALSAMTQAFSKGNWMTVKRTHTLVYSLEK